MTPITLNDSAGCKARPSLIAPSRPNALCLDCSRRDAYLADSDPQIEPKWGRIAGVWQCLDRRSSGVVSEHAQSVASDAVVSTFLELGVGVLNAGDGSHLPAADPAGTASPGASVAAQSGAVGAAARITGQV